MGFACGSLGTGSHSVNEKGSEHGFCRSEHFTPHIRQIMAYRCVLRGGSHPDEIGSWLPDVSAGQGIHSLYEGDLFPYAGYHFCSHPLATNRLPPLSADFSSVATRSLTSRTRRYEMDWFSGFATVEWE